MEQVEIFKPALVLLLLTFIVWIYLYYKRIPFIIKSNFAPNELTPLELQRRSPSEVYTPADNFKNLCELPVLFYFLCLYLFVTSQVDSMYLIAAWCFVFFRVLHSVVHCTFNKVTVRFFCYLLSSISLWWIALRAIGLLFY